MKTFDDYKKCYVYGAGFIGKCTAGYLELCKNKRVDALVVSNGHREIANYLYPQAVLAREIKVLEFREVPNDQPADYYVTLDKGKEEVIEMLRLENVGGGEVVDVSPEFDTIIEEYNKIVLMKHGIHLSDNYLDFNGVKCYNYLKESKVIRKTFWETYGDELLPSIYNDNGLAADGPYEIEVLKVSVEPGDVVFDVGANLGLFCCYAANKGCKVYAFDPDQTCGLFLNEQKKIYPEIEIVPIGLSSKKGTTEFFESEDCALSSMSRIAEGKLNKIEVEIDTLDNYVIQNNIKRIDFLKADIEGEERNMLRGATYVLREMHPKLSICTYHYPEDPVLLERIIKEANPEYVVNHAWRKLYAYVPERK